MYACARSGPPTVDKCSGRKVSLNSHWIFETNCKLAATVDLFNHFVFENDLSDFNDFKHDLSIFKTIFKVFYKNVRYNLTNLLIEHNPISRNKHFQSNTLNKQIQ